MEKKELASLIGNKAAAYLTGKNKLAEVAKGKNKLAEVAEGKNKLAEVTKGENKLVSRKKLAGRKKKQRTRPSGAAAQTALLYGWRFDFV